MELDAKTIQKYKGCSVAWLLSKTQEYFNKYIRLRDADRQCISCESWSIAHASHFYSVGHYSTLRFNEMNCHASCVKCNKWLHGNLNEYRKRIVHRIGEDGLKELDMLAAADKRNKHKWDRLELIYILETYKAKIKEL